jgi:tetratricopeptide (TPR) repeat protein
MSYLNARIVRFLFACILGLSVLPASGENGDDVIIGKPEMGQLFAAQYRYYQSQSAGSFSVQNNSRDNLYAEVSVTVAGYAPNPLITTVALPAGKTTQVPLRIDFNLDKLPAQGEPLVLDAGIQFNVSSENEPLFQKRLSATFQLYNLHSLPNEPPEAIAVFIDAGDQSVAEFVQVAKGEVRTEPLAQRLFELMKGAKIICVIQAAQTVQYPRELLRTKIGSHYDCALLYAALLEGAGVPVALAVSDDYILVLWQQLGGQVEEPQQKEVISWMDKRWIPLDIRMLKGTFPEAKAAGMQAYENLKREGRVKPFMLRDAWERYKPVRFVSPQSVKEIQLGITYAQGGVLDRAEQAFNKHLNGDARAAAYNNLGNLYLFKSKYPEAVSHYLKAVEADPGDGGILLNLGIAYFVTGEEDNVVNEMFDRAYSALGSYAQMCYALAINLKGPDHSEVRLLMRKAEERALQNRTRPLGIRALPPNKPLPLYWKRR